MTCHKCGRKEKNCLQLHRLRSWLVFTGLVLKPVRRTAFPLLSARPAGHPWGQIIHDEF